MEGVVLPYINPIHVKTILKLQRMCVERIREGERNNASDLFSDQHSNQPVTVWLFIFCQVRDCFCCSPLDPIRENLGPGELAANDFDKRSAGSEDTSHVVREQNRFIQQVSPKLGIGV